MTASSTIDRSPWPPRALAAALIIGSALARIIYLGWISPLNLAPDEAHYWDWSRHLDWSYYSKGPLVALLIRASCEMFGPLSVALTGTESLAVRLPAVACGALLSTALYILTVQVWRRETWALGVVAVGITIPILTAGASLMTIDAPFSCLWAWALVTGFEAVVRGRRWAWPATGLLIALGILAKPIMVLWLPCFGLFLLATPAVRPLLWRREFALLAGIACLGAAPILYWNSQNHWATIRHTYGHAGVTAHQAVYWTGPLNYVGTQVALLFVYWFIVWVAALWRFRPWTETRLEERYLWWMSAPIFVFFGLFSLKNGGGEPNWPIVCYLAGLVLAVGWLAEQIQSPRMWLRRATVAGIVFVAVLGLAATAVVLFPLAFQPSLSLLVGPATPQRPMPLRRVDPTTRLRGWQTLAAEVDVARRDLRAHDVDPVIAATSWFLPGEIAFYIPDHPTVYSIGVVNGDRRSQYDLWRPNPLADPEPFLGKSFIIVGAGDAFLKKAFDHVETTRVIQYREGEHLICEWLITIAHGYRGFGELAKNDGW
jgi:4-amino-4-deoxy-L-arabinose transferase-like glycosyltransferase